MKAKILTLLKNKSIRLFLYIAISYISLFISSYISKYIVYIPLHLYVKCIISSIISLFLYIKSYADFIQFKSSFKNNKTFDTLRYSTHLLINIFNIAFHFITFYVS